MRSPILKKYISGIGSGLATSPIVSPSRAFPQGQRGERVKGALCRPSVPSGPVKNMIMQYTSDGVAVENWIRSKDV
ncbi:hypothetical protein GWI33_004959 [Rhynchophorus ferrugineus]|uniref:Uncharacterized protein n=1 Tax=Rhynchophorus ferrugineus TaxID=354439 RepID=A0A834II95_RHYFE|nr:hypothetical protein GWI33_004959 [Rhynchophorus ferrugineus]